MKIKYLEWSDLNKLEVSGSTVYSLLVPNDILKACEKLVNTYMREQSSALNQLTHFKQLLKDKADALNMPLPEEDAVFNDLLVEMEWILEDEVHDTIDYIQAQLTVYTRLLTARIAFNYMLQLTECKWLDSRDLILTNDNWVDAQIDAGRARDMVNSIDADSIYVTTHGIGCTSDNQNTITAVDRYWHLVF